MSPAEDTPNVPTGFLVAPVVLLGAMVVSLKRLLLWSICLRLLVVFPLVVLAAAPEATTATAPSTTVAAVVSTPPGASLLLMELFEFVAIFSVVSVLLVE